jgi:hypothetical protein
MLHIQLLQQKAGLYMMVQLKTYLMKEVQMVEQLVIHQMG